MNDSIANTLAVAPSRAAPRRAAAFPRRGERRRVHWENGKWPANCAPCRRRRTSAGRPAGAAATGSSRCHAASSEDTLLVVGAELGRPEWPLLHSSSAQSTMLPCASRAARVLTTIAGPKGSHANSSSRIHCTCTGGRRPRAPAARHRMPRRQRHYGRQHPAPSAWCIEFSRAGG